PGPAGVQEVAEWAGLVLGKTPEVEGRLRVVEVADFDLNACGGTHVARTGSVGMIKILKTERRGDTLRVEFRCGGRALAEFRSRHAVLSDLSAALTTGYTDVPAVVEKLREENQSLRKELRAARSALLDLEAERLRAATPHNGEYARGRYPAVDGDPRGARAMVQSPMAHPQALVLCAGQADNAQLFVARSEALPQEMVPVLRAGLSALGVERGGGPPSFPQGGATPAT